MRWYHFYFMLALLSSVVYCAVGFVYGNHPTQETDDASE